MLNLEGAFEQWAQHRRSNGPIQRSTPGWAVRRSGALEVPRPLVTFATQRNGQSGAGKLNGATILVAERQKRTGAVRSPGMVRLDHFRLRMDDGSVYFALLLRTYSTIRSIPRGVPICSI